MAKNPGNPDEGSEFNKIDLSTFEEFSFGTEWTEASGPGEGGSSDRPPRRRDGGGAPGRDRRPPRRFPPRDGEARPSHGPGEDRGERGPRRDRRGPPREGGGRAPHRPVREFHTPYESRIFEVAFYPEDHGFNALVKAMRTSCRTYELFEIARLILEKAERCVVVYHRWPDEDKSRKPLAISIPDGLPFETEDEAVQHVLAVHLDKFFTVEEIEAEPPKGTFQIVHICPNTKEILGPPNYHRYAHIVEQHHAARVSHVHLERYRGSLISSREPEDIQAWLEKMKKATRYTSKPEVAEEAGVFDSPEEARAYLLRVARGKMVKMAESARIEAKDVAKSPETEAARAMQGALERQRRFPLDTANALRGRLRRENFHIFKRGSKGITFACSVRRKFRVPGQSFADSVEKLINYLEANPLTPIGALPDRYLNIPIHGDPDGNHDEIEKLPEEKREALKKMAMDLRWLVTEGYVAEYSDGRLLAAPSDSQPAQEKKPKAKTPPDRKKEGVADKTAKAAVAAVAPLEGEKPGTDATTAEPVVETAALAPESPPETPAPEAEAPVVPEAPVAPEDLKETEPESVEAAPAAPSESAAAEPLTEASAGSLPGPEPATHPEAEEEAQEKPKSSDA